MRSTDAVVLLGVFSVGVFLAGLELMITAVALPAIILDFAPDPLLAYTELRKASWIVNGYLLVYVIAMPLAGRLTDIFGARRLLLIALVLFTLGSALAGRAQSLEELIAARLVQAAGGGILVPVGNAAAAHLFAGSARPRALGVIHALTFLGMAAGPFVGAAILGSVNAADALARLGLADSGLGDVVAPSWRWIFYVNVPIGIAALAVAWAASSGWDTPRHSARVDIPGGIVFSAALATGLVGLTLWGAPGGEAGLDPATASAVLLGVGGVLLLVAIVYGFRRQDPFLDPRLFGRIGFSSAALVSLLTGYTLATAIIGGAVFVDQVLYGGPDEQRLALGALAGATAVGALVSGLALRLLGLRPVTLVGLAASTGALVVMSGFGPGTPIVEVAGVLAVFGLGFGLTITPRSTAAVEAVGRQAFGAASATVAVARHIGMAIGLGVLTAYGSTQIDRLADAFNATPDAYKAFIPVELRDRPLQDGLVVEALEAWRAGEAATIMVGIFLAAAVVSAVAVPPALVMGRRGRRAVATDAPAVPPRDTEAEAEHGASVSL
jgi:MFS family permease